jgi:hypothetical protein
MASKALTTLNQTALDQPASSPVPVGTVGAVDAAKATSQYTSDPPIVSSVIQNLKQGKKTFLK